MSCLENSPGPWTTLALPSGAALKAGDKGGHGLVGAAGLHLVVPSLFRFALATLEQALGDVVGCCPAPLLLDGELLLHRVIWTTGEQFSGSELTHSPSVYDSAKDSTLQRALGILEKTDELHRLEPVPALEEWVLPGRILNLDCVIVHALFEVLRNRLGSHDREEPGKHTRPRLHL